MTLSALSLCSLDLLIAYCICIYSLCPLQQLFSTVHRCTAGFEGLKEQGVTNYITLTFIMKYDMLFLNPGEMSPYKPEFDLVRHCFYCLMITMLWLRGERYISKVIAQGMSINIVSEYVIQFVFEITCQNRCIFKATPSAASPLSGRTCLSSVYGNDSGSIAPKPLEIG